MQKRRWIMVLVEIGLVGVVAVSGCKKRPKVGPTGVGDVGGITGSDLYGQGLAERFEGGREIAGQFTPVYFDYDSAVIKEGERGKIETVASHLKRNPAVQLVVEGHCDERGSNEYNLALGERRALAVRAYLIGLGIDGNRIQTRSYGEERPVAMGHDESAWSQNRRGEFVLVQ